MHKRVQWLCLAGVYFLALATGCAPTATLFPASSTPGPNSALRLTNTREPTYTPLPTNTRTPTLTPLPTKTPHPPTATLAPGLTAAPTLPPLEDFVGIWLNTEPQAGGWPRIITAREGGTLIVDFREACELPAWWSYPIDCEGGVASVTYNGSPVRLALDYGNAIYTVTLSLNGDILRVNNLVHYTDNSGRADSTADYAYREQEFGFRVSEQIVWYHFAQGAYHVVPAGSVLTPTILFTAVADQVYTADTAADLRTALTLALQDEGNRWVSREVEIAEVSFGSGQAGIVLAGEYSAETDRALADAGLQILLTVFANPTVQTAVITLNGESIGNLGLSHGAPARPADYVYTRTAMAAFINEQGYWWELEHK